MHLKYEYTRLLAETFSASSYLSYKSHRWTVMVMLRRMKPIVPSIMFYIILVMPQEVHDIAQHLLKSRKQKADRKREALLPLAQSSPPSSVLSSLSLLGKRRKDPAQWM
ncbi:hypothetical protein F8M41_009098 [Gigaspora margarita]|uniref:Uncharacterized protein n=1 Tax=Gigaspora margarita TaxID=4874 RepID=A0A8H3X3D5_GIGMA|nr:hypothetical protein F8M41_009098 [Gigaspora margarita]